MASPVTYQRDESVVRIGMDDGKLNLLNPQMLADLDEAFERAGGEGVPVVLRGREGVMSAGFDLKVLQGGDGAAADLLKAGFALSRRIFSFPAPVVVACTGHAIAMGLFLVMSADYRIGVAGPFRITANEVQIGMTLPRAAIDVCRQRLAHPYFDRVAMLAEVFTPETALPAGIFSRVVDPAELDVVLDEVTVTLAGLNIRAHEGTKLRAREEFLATLDRSIVADDADFRAALPSG
ncbi:MAG: crotonase/enoyl-CoA hydratase family protein [Acidimicrobiales bacterium]